MPDLSRRNFLKLGGAAAAGVAMAPHLAIARSTATGETTLAQTVVRGAALGHGRSSPSALRVRIEHRWFISRTSQTSI
jgi:hypothetical protein